MCKEHKPGIQRPGLFQTIRNGPSWASVRLYGLFTSPRSRMKSHQPGKMVVTSEWQSENHLIVQCLLPNPLPHLFQLLAESSSCGYRTEVPFPCWCSAGGCPSSLESFLRSFPVGTCISEPATAHGILLMLGMLGLSLLSYLQASSQRKFPARKASFD